MISGLVTVPEYVGIYLNTVKIKVILRGKEKKI